MSNALVTDAAAIQKGIERAEFVKKEIEVLYVWACSFIPYFESITYLHPYLQSFNTGRDISTDTIPANGLLKVLS